MTTMPGFFTKTLAERDPEVFKAIGDELHRQQDQIELIASENIVSRAVLEAQGSVLTNKYAEGYPGRRYYGGCEFVDVAEALAIERAKKLFDCNFANVQPHSGAQANEAVYQALLNPGDPVLAFKLDHGGHLTHGFKLNSSGKLYKFEHYGVNRETERLDYDEIQRLAESHRPKLIVAGATAYPRIIDPEPIRAIADEVGAIFLFDAAHIAGLIAGGVHPNPVPYADIVTFTTHKTLRGPRGGCILSKKEYAEAIDKAVFPGLQGGPLDHVIAAKAVAFSEAAQPEFKDYANQIVLNAAALAEALAGEGFRLVSGGTDNHLMLLDLLAFDKELSGKKARGWLDRAGISLNENTVPNDPRPPYITSGLRIGTPAVTSAGMREAEMATIAALIGQTIRSGGDAGQIAEVRENVKQLCAGFAPYPEG